MIKKIAFLLLFTSLSQAASLRLENDSICPLKAVIQAADGSILSEVFLESKETKNWTDQNNLAMKKKAPVRSLTPLTVHWYCKGGESFSISDHVSTGALVRAKDGTGNKNCPDKKDNPEGKS